MVTPLGIQDREGHWLSVGDNDRNGPYLRAAGKPHHYLLRQTTDQILTKNGWTPERDDSQLYFASFEAARQHALTLTAPQKSILEQALEVAEGW